VKILEMPVRTRDWNRDIPEAEATAYKEAKCYGEGKHDGSIVTQEHPRVSGAMSNAEPRAGAWTGRGLVLVSSPDPADRGRAFGGCRKRTQTLGFT
jgi:hypothetical protein